MIDGYGSYLNTLDSMLVVGGGARSGTTIMGKIVASMERVEYFFEPPMFIPLFLNETGSTVQDLKSLVDAYFYEELLINSLAGRNLNFNSCDDSYIGNVKEDAEIKLRLSRSSRRKELDRLASLSRFSFKSPYSVFFVGQLREIYKYSNFLMMHRSLHEVINSILVKGWFSDSYLNPMSTGTVHACLVENNVKVPFWVEKNDIDFWVGSPEIDRAIYYYVRISEEMLKHKDICLIVDYDALLRNPMETVCYIASKLDLNFSSKTHNIIDSISLQNSSSSFFSDCECSSYWYNRALELDAALKLCTK